MKIDTNDLITLSNDLEYVVVANVLNNEKLYYYIVNISNKKDVKFVYQEDDTLVVVKDDKIINELIPLFVQKLNTDLKF